MTRERIHVVIAGGILFGAYRDRQADSAELHARCITGATVVSCELFEHVPREVLDDIQTEWDVDAEEDTPVTVVKIGDLDE